MRFLVMVLSMIFIPVSCDLAQAGGRIAFVAGNGAYRSMEPLPNAPGSARAVSDLLRKLGFELIEAIDLPRSELDSRLLEFAGKTNGADVALFYYSGHAVGVGDHQYLLPVDADIKPLEDVTQGGGINLAAAVDRAMADAALKLVFIDASRDNPAWTKAPASTPAKATGDNLSSATGSLIMFATGPGQTAPDGPAGGIRPFTRALVANLATPGLDIMQAMSRVRAQLYDETKGKQIAWSYSDIVGAVSLNPAVPPAPPK